MSSIYDKHINRFERHVVKPILKRRNSSVQMGYKYRVKPFEKTAELLEKALANIKRNPDSIRKELDKVISAGGVGSGAEMLALIEIADAVKMYDKTRYTWANKRYRKTPQESEFLKRVGRKLGLGVKLDRGEIDDLKELFKKFDVPKDARLK